MEVINEMTKEKRKMVVIEDLIHKHIKHIATDKDSSIQEEINNILKKELNIKEE